jgi:hypothetical protein
MKLSKGLFYRFLSLLSELVTQISTKWKIWTEIQLHFLAELWESTLREISFNLCHLEMWKMIQTDWLKWFWMRFQDSLQATLPRLVLNQILQEEISMLRSITTCKPNSQAWCNQNFKKGFSGWKNKRLWARCNKTDGMQFKLLISLIT